MTFGQKLIPFDLFVSIPLFSNNFVDGVEDIGIDDQGQQHDEADIGSFNRILSSVGCSDAE